ncbi:hypothetical protein [uncultured Microscilla sp.]|uniref:hypothetical protein n=1 Tax=uncultured Microscilla sp. TaxID=432653 RepID=UPI0026204721|nr:hypothetical protein [uncultured Microscilla sp.]
MKTIQLTFLITALLVVTANTYAQKLTIPTYSFSGEKLSYINLKDGSKIEAKISKLYRKKGQIRAVKIKDANGNKRKIEAADIKNMYLAPSGFDKFNKFNSFMNDATQWRDNDLDKDILKQGFVYLEQTEVQIKKKKRTLIMQVLNPTFCGKIRIFHNPFAGKSMGLGVAGINVVGGKDTSYYIKKGDAVAYKIKKKNYKKEFKVLFADCEEVKKQFPKIKWNELPKHVFTFDKHCK